MTTPPPSDAASPDASRGRMEYVENARAKWLARLIDTSRRNNLLYFRELKAGTLDMTSAAPAAMTELLMREEVPLRRFFPDRTPAGQAALTVAESKLAGIRAKAVSNAEERGIETMYLAMGLASWPAKDDKRPTDAPILLVPIHVNKSGRGGQGFSLVRSGDIQANLVLIHVLREDLNVEITEEELLRDLQGDDEGESFDLGPVEKILVERCREIPGFVTRNRVVIGNFAFQKTAMVQDLLQSAEALAQHDLIAALAGHPGARQHLANSGVSHDPREIDEVMPDQEFLVLDADSSQQTVIRNAMSLRNGVIQGPPGTGKSQTIANLIAELAAAGKRVLFVAEKRAALQVVLDRLTNRGLGHLALDLHGAEISRADVMKRLKASLDLVSQAPASSPTRIHNDFVKRRDVLLRHLQRMHSRRAPTDRSVYDMQGRLLALGGVERVRTRWSGGALAALTPARIEDARDALRELQPDWALFLRQSDSPWNGAAIEGAESAHASLANAQMLARELGALMDLLRAQSGALGLMCPASAQHVEARLALLGEADERLAEFDADIVRQPEWELWHDGIAPARRSRAVQVWAFITNTAYRHALRSVRGYWRAEACGVTQLEASLTALREHVGCWRAVAIDPRGVPMREQGLADLRERWQRIRRSLAALEPIVSGLDARTQSLEELHARSAALAGDRQAPLRLARMHPHELKLRELGLQDLVEEFRERLVPSTDREDLLEIAWYGSALEEVQRADLDLATFQGTTHDQVVAEFRALDRQRIDLAASRVRAEHSRRAVEAMNRHQAQEGALRAECEKKRGKSVRRLLNEIPQVLTALRPCWMASPLSVSQLLPAMGGLFDIVLFDEASQVLPEDAVPALLRAPCAVVAGDRHQLPPTQFFVGGEEGEDEVEEESTAAQDFESILDQMSGLFPAWTLDWHYRSLDESLIAFSNQHIYGGRLVTFPGAGRYPSMEHHLATQPLGFEGGAESVAEEVQRVVELILHHASERPGESLGVITLGIKHQQRIERQLEFVLRSRPDLDPFFEESKKERFFIKNLERVQGDERDAIILSVGYGKDSAGRLLYRFGPLNQQGGERRLNVAITRARRRLALVSSFSHVDMDPAKTKALGTNLLRLYLAYAASGGRTLGQTREAEVPLNDFEQDVFDALKAKGLDLLPQWGVSRYRIDMVAKHPSSPGRFVLAIECDGATYHSAYTARDRDRLRQQHLEALGWRFHRIWSTDWFLNRDAEIERAARAYEDAVATADHLDASGGAGVASPAESAVSVDSSRAVMTRGPRPIKGGRDSIERYKPSELLELVRWVQSDGRLRTDSQILEEMVEALEFNRRGARIVEAIASAIAQYRAHA